MVKIKDVTREFETALKTDNFDDFFSLLESNKSLTKQRFNENKVTLLHFMCAINISQLKYGSLDFSTEKNENKEEIEYLVSEENLLRAIEKFIDDYDFDINSKDALGNTPLHYAVSNNNAALVNMLLEYSDIEIDSENKQGVTPLQIAVQLGYREIEQVLVYNLNIDKEEQIDESKSIKEQQRLFKQTLIAQGAMRNLIGNPHPNIPEALEAVIYFQNKNKDEEFRGLLQKMYEIPILQPLMNFMALYTIKPNLAEGRIRYLLKEKAQLEKYLQIENEELLLTRLTQIERELKKTFKIFCVDTNDIRSIKPLAGEAEGIYTNKNSIFIAAPNDRKKERITGVIFHEATHYAMHHIIREKFLFSPEDTSSAVGNLLWQIVYDTKQNLKNIEGSCESENDYENYYILSGAFNPYPVKEWASELLARFTQILTSSPNGYRWLNNHVPRLLSFYTDVINPRINEFLREEKFTSYIAAEKTKSMSLIS